MSKVSIEDIYFGVGLNEKEILNVEIVPRKMVEMIIERCNRDINTFNTDKSIPNTICYEAKSIKKYAERLLREFEEEPEEEKQTYCRNCKYLNTVDIKNNIYSCTLKGGTVFGFEGCGSWEERGKK